MYERKVWVNRQSEHPARRKLTPTGNDGEYDVSRSEGVIMEDGDAFDADTMNDLERRVAAGFTELDPTGAGGGEVTVQPYTCEKKNGVYALVGSGAVGRCKIPADWVSGDTFSVNGNVVPAYCGADTVDGDTIIAGRWVLFTYDGNRLDFNGGGGLSASKLAQATAADTDVLTGKKYYAGGKTIKEGKMPNRCAVNKTIDPGGSYTIPAGYHNGAGKVAANYSGVSIFAVSYYNSWKTLFLNSTFGKANGSNGITISVAGKYIVNVTAEAFNYQAVAGVKKNGSWIIGPSGALNHNITVSCAKGDVITCVAGIQGTMIVRCA